MPTVKTVTGYKLAELKTVAPEVFAKLHEKWREGCYQDETPWQHETMQSLKAVVYACGATLTDWSIGTDSGRMSVRVDNEYEYTNATGDHYAKKGPAWFRREVLKPNGYTRPNGRAYFPGHCHWTGYCADDCFIERVYQRILKGDTLTDALESLASLASEMMGDDMEQGCEEDSMLANWGENLYDLDGDEVK